MNRAELCEAQRGRVKCAAGGGGDGGRIGGEWVSRHFAKCVEGVGMEDWWLMLLHHFYSTTRGRPRKVLRVQIFSRFLLRATAMASEREAAPRLRMMAAMCCLTADAEMPQAAAI